MGLQVLLELRPYHCQRPSLQRVSLCPSNSSAGRAHSSAASTADVALASPPSTETGKNDIPAQNETGANHQTIPAPQITPVTVADPAKDRTLNGATTGTNTDTTGTKPISNDPVVSASEAKKEAEQTPAATGSTPAAAQGKTTDATATPPAAEAKTDAPSAAAVTGVAAPSGAAASTTTPAPVTPAKKTATGASTPGGASTASTPAKDGERKRKTSFFKKVSARLCLSSTY